MSVTRAHGLYAVGVGSTILGGITQQSNPTGTETRGEAGSGKVYPEIQSIVAQKPNPSFTTLDVAACLAAIGLIGQDIAALTGGLALYGQARVRGGTRAGAGLHTQNLYRDGILHLGTLSVDANGDATLSCQSVITYDGTNSPVIVSHVASLPTAPADDVRFALGPVTLAGISFGQVTNLEINFGITPATESADGDVWDTFPSIETIAPSITLKGTDLKWISPDAAPNDAVPLVGRVLAHTDTTIYLRKRAKGGTFVADATAQHVKFTAAGMAVLDDGMNVSGTGVAEASLKLPLLYDTGTGQVPLIVNTASAIT